jgi:hypothetical protein
LECRDDLIGYFGWATSSIGEKVDVFGGACTHPVLLDSVAAA